ncbi:uncharacterized protein BJ212DRAFT_1278277, partial [Suillus subaureus]
VLAIMANSASNNDTMCEALQELCQNEGVTFNAHWGRLQCMLHTTHLSALVLLEGIGAIKASSMTKNHNAYQDCVTAPLSREYDNNVAGQEDQPDEVSSDSLHEVLSAVSKVSSS